MREKGRKKKAKEKREKEKSESDRYAKVLRFQNETLTDKNPCSPIPVP